LAGEHPIATASSDQHDNRNPISPLPAAPAHETSLGGIATACSYARLQPWTAEACRADNGTTLTDPPQDHVKATRSNLDHQPPRVPVGERLGQPAERLLASELKCAIYSVGYRLAPEAPQEDI
jgi:hypothetical protein